MPNWGTEVLPEGLNWENFKLTLYGYNIIKFSSFEFKEKADISINHGMGGMPVSWSKKKTEFEAKATLHVDELKQLVVLAVAYGGMLTQLPPAPVTAEAKAGSVTWTLTIPAVKFKEVSYQFKQGDDKVEVPVDLVVLGFPSVSMS